MSPVHVNGQTVQLQPAHRTAAQDAPIVTVHAAIELTYEEVTALLYDWIAYGGDLAELADDERIRALVAESVVNGGCMQVDALAARAPLGGELLETCGRRAREVFSA